MDRLGVSLRTLLDQVGTRVGLLYLEQSSVQLSYGLRTDLSASIRVSLDRVLFDPQASLLQEELGG